MASHALQGRVWHEIRLCAYKILFWAVFCGIIAGVATCYINKAQIRNSLDYLISILSPMVATKNVVIPYGSINIERGLLLNVKMVKHSARHADRACFCSPSLDKTEHIFGWRSLVEYRNCISVVGKRLRNNHIQGGCFASIFDFWIEADPSRMARNIGFDIQEKNSKPCSFIQNTRLLHFEQLPFGNFLVGLKFAF